MFGFEPLVLLGGLPVARLAQSDQSEKLDDSFWPILLTPDGYIQILL